MNNLSSKIKLVREDLKLSQIEFANSLNISRSGVAQIELNKTNPSFDLIYKIVKLYGISPDFFFNDSNNDLTKENVFNNAQVKSQINAQVSQNDLNILVEVSYFPSIDEVLPYLSNSEARNKAILKDAKQELREKIITYNSIIEIGKMFKFNEFSDKYNDFINIEEHIKEIINECNPDDYKEGLVFDSIQLKTIIQIIALKDSIEHISFLTDKKVKYLKKDCAYLIRVNEIKI